MSFYLGIDFGTSGARAVVIDPTATVQAEVSLPFPPSSPEVWSTLWQTSLFELITQLPLGVRSQIQRLAINGTSATILLCDPDGHPVYPPLLYNDSRSAIVLPLLSSIAPPAHAVLNASSGLAKLLWLSQQPSFAQARFLMHQADWLAFLLHGQAGITDYHNCLKLGYDPAQERYPDWFNHPVLLPLLPLLPQVVAPGTPIATVRAEIAAQLHLPSHCQVCAGTTDSIAAFLASGAKTPGVAVTSLGSTLVLKLLSQSPAQDSRNGIYSHRLGSMWLVGGASNTGGGVLRHYFTDEELVRLSQQIDPDRPSGLDYYPLLQPGERFPINDPHLEPRLTPRPDDPVAFLHGLLESLARIEAQGYQLLAQQGANRLTQVLTAGGGAKNPTWTALRQRYLGVTVCPSPHSEAAYGTARLALEGMNS